jgi:protein tyrosine/serine phosphatase
MRTPNRWILAAIVCGLGVLAVGPMRSYVFETNLHPVFEGEIYRSAQPSGARLGEWIEELDLKSVVNLRGRKGDDDRRWLLEEVAVAEQAGIEHVSIRMSAGDVPPAPTLRKLVDTLDSAPRPLLLHCKAGAERSALAAAVAVLLETGDLDAARAEFALDKGFVEWINPRLPRLLDAYAAWLAERGETSTPDRFRTWAHTEYAPYFYKAKIEPIDVPIAFAPNAPTELRFRVTNTSREPIPFRSTRDRGVHLGAKITGADGVVRRELRGGYVDLRLAPGESTELTLSVPALDAPGPWSLRVDLVDEGVKWFGALGSEPLDLPIEVAATH